MAYGDDKDIIGRTSASMKEACQLLEKTSKDVGLVINKGKTTWGIQVVRYPNFFLGNGSR